MIDRTKKEVNGVLFPARYANIAKKMIAGNSHFYYKKPRIKSDEVAFMNSLGLTLKVVGPIDRCSEITPVDIKEFIARCQELKII